MHQRFDFASDNVAGAMPEVIEALNHFNAGFAASYGEDDVSARASNLIRELLDVDAEVHFISSGTAANALTLAALAAPHEAIIAHALSHAATDETGAPGLFGAGMGIIAASGPSGRIDIPALGKALAQPEGAHWQSPAAISITNATEFGTIYREADLAPLTEAAKQRDLKVHVDGARLANAAAAGFNLKSLARLGADVVVLGGTKAGSTPTEAIVLIEPSVRRRFGARLKHGGQLVSKARFLAAPWVGMLEAGAWMRRAGHANAMARRLAELMPFPLAHPVEANGVFVRMDDEQFVRLRDLGWVVERFSDGAVRFMCSWATTTEGVDELGEALTKLA
jgi:threonine aldolase